MANISIPPPDADGYWHFTYITIDTDGRWYGGKRSTKKHPLFDRYLGSGNWVRMHRAQERLRRDILAFHATSTAAFAAEAELVTWTAVLDDPLCMNLRDGGEGMTVEAARRRSDSAKHNAGQNWRVSLVEGIARRTADPKWQKAHAANLRRLHNNPDVQSKIAASNRRLALDPEWQGANIAAARKRADDPILRAKNAAMLRLRGADPEFRAKASAGAHRRYADPAERAKARAIATIREAEKAAKRITLGRPQHSKTALLVE